MIAVVAGWKFSIWYLFQKFQANFPWLLYSGLLEKQFANLFPSSSAPLGAGFRFRSIGRVPPEVGLTTVSFEKDEAVT